MTTTSVLFVGDDASSTQIAESLLRLALGDRVAIRTAGARPSTPGGREDQMLVMMGLNPAHEERINLRALTTSDWVVVLGTTLDVARVAGRTYEEWDLTTNSLDERVEDLAARILHSLDGSGPAEPPARRRRPRWRRGGAGPDL